MDPSHIQMEYYIKGLPLKGSYIPSLVPTGTYKYEHQIKITHTNDTLYSIIVIAQITNNILAIW